MPFQTTTVSVIQAPVITSHFWREGELNFATKTLEIHDVQVLTYNAHGATVWGRLNADALPGVTHVWAHNVEYHWQGDFENRYVYEDALLAANWSPMGSIMRIGAPDTATLPGKTTIVDEAVLAGWIVNNRY